MFLDFDLRSINYYFYKTLSSLLNKMYHMLSLYFQFLMTLGSSSYLSLSIFYPQYLLGSAPSVVLFPLSLEINFVVSCAERIKTDFRISSRLRMLSIFSFSDICLRKSSTIAIRINISN